MSSCVRSMRRHILKHAIQLTCVLQYSNCTFVTTLLRLLAKLFVNLAVCVRTLVTKFASIFWRAEQALRRMPFSTEWSCARRWSSHGSRTIFPLGLLGIIVLDAFFTFCCVDLGKGYLHASSYRVGNPSEHCPSDFHCHQSPRLLCSLRFLTKTLVSKFAFLTSKFFFTLQFCSIQPVKIKFGFFFWGWISTLYHSNTVLSFSDSRILNFSYKIEEKQLKQLSSQTLCSKEARLPHDLTGWRDYRVWARDRAPVIATWQKHGLLHRLTQAVSARRCRTNGTSWARAFARAVRNCAVSTLHLPPTSAATTTRRALPPSPESSG